jgi:hypothetical protein
LTSLVGRPSDGVPEILATGGAEVTTVFVSMSGRDPAGRDADYIRWHSLDHRPEQHRLQTLTASVRVVSTPQCRAARAISTPRYDEVDHIVTYLFSDIEGLKGFQALSTGLRDAGRHRSSLPSVERGAFRLEGRLAAPRIKVGADVLPWWPARGAYVLIEESAEPPAPDIVAIPGVGGAWWGTAVQHETQVHPKDDNPLQFTYCYLDDDPSATAGRLTDHLEKRWAERRAVPLLAAPFHPIVSYEWDRYLP